MMEEDLIEVVDLESDSESEELPPRLNKQDCNTSQELINEIIRQMHPDDKKYYCQRCLNHGMHIPRKGHKPRCQFLKCTCTNCDMVEQRRKLNNRLGKTKVPTMPKDAPKGPRIRDPQCARCGAHGLRMPLRGHKKSQCQFVDCECELCGLVENRRSLMAKQIKLRRYQQRDRMAAAQQIGTQSPAAVKTRKISKRTRSTSDSVGSSGSSESSPPMSPLSSPCSPPSTQLQQQPSKPSIHQPIPVKLPPIITHPSAFSFPIPSAKISPNFDDASAFLPSILTSPPPPQLSPVDLMAALAAFGQPLGGGNCGGTFPAAQPYIGFMILQQLFQNGNGCNFNDV